MQRVIHYFHDIKPNKLVLWCYLIWYLNTVFYYFDPSIKIWINSIGISLVIGAALNLSVSRTSATNRWQVFRLFWMPFAVSSFSALIKDQHFFVIFSPRITENLSGVVACFLFCSAIFVLKKCRAGGE